VNADNLGRLLPVAEGGQDGGLFQRAWPSCRGWRRWDRKAKSVLGFTAELL